MPWRTTLRQLETGVPRGMRKAFTLVELLVVIGIIALLIAILMPALSRARKQALQASCGSNERQTTYAAIAYGNDWKQFLPTRLDATPALSNTARYVSYTARLPIVGFDTITIWDYGTFQICCCSAGALGGWSFMLRDYLKNDHDVVVCPDGWFSGDQLLNKWGNPPTAGCWGGANIGNSLFIDGALAVSGYLWLPHRAPETSNLTGPCLPTVAGGFTPKDTVQDVVRTTSGKPDLLVMADFIQIHARWAGGWQDFACMAANHTGSDFRGAMRSDACTDRVPVRPENDARNNPDLMPLGSNRSRVDARTEWVPWQDIARPHPFRDCAWSNVNFGHAW